MTTKQKTYYNGEILNLAKGFIEAGFTLDHCNSIVAIIDEAPELYRSLTNPGFSSNQKKTVIDKIFTNTLEKNSLKYLLDCGYIHCLQVILQAVEDLLLLDSKTVEGILTYAKELPDKVQLQSMEKSLLSHLDANAVKWTFIKDPNLIDGFTLEVKGLFYDYSLNGKFNKLLNHLNRR